MGRRADVQDESGTMASRYEERLSELSALAYPSDEEQLEEVTLKKKKLAIKDQMYSLMLQHEKTASTEH